MDVVEGPYRARLIDFDELEIESYIGQGNSGVVFGATRRGHPVHLVVKFLGRGDEWLSMRPPPDILARLGHPNLVRVLGFSFEPGREQHVLVCEKATGHSLAQLHSMYGEHERPLLKLLDALSVMLQIARALEFLHSRGVFHTGLKPSNVFVNSRVKVGDFGLGTTYWASEPTLTTAEAVFVAPELRNFERYSDRGDVYSFGVICYGILKGSFAVEERGSRLASFSILIPDLVDLIEECLDVDPDRRPTFPTTCDKLEQIHRRLLTSGDVQE